MSNINNNLLELLKKHYSNSSLIEDIINAQRIGNNFIYIELFDGRSAIYELCNDNLYLYKKSETISKTDAFKIKSIFRELKIDEIIEN